MSEKDLEPTHPLAGNILLGNCCVSLRKFGEAEALLQRALEVRTKSLGPEDLRVADCFIALGQCYLQQEKFAEGAEMFRRSVEIREKVLGPTNPGVAERLQHPGNLQR